MYDVIIIGAGPAGLMAARTLKEKCVENFVIIDPKKELGRPLRCGEGIGVHEFHEFFPEGDYKFVKNTGYAHEVIYEDLKRVFSCPFYQVDRSEFEKWMGEAVSENVKLETKCTDVNFYDNRVEVVTDKDLIVGKMIIVCYGSNFFIQKKIGIKKIPKVMIAGYGGIYKIKSIDKRKFYYYFVKEHKGYLWIFPKSDYEANIGFGAFNFNGNIKETLQKLLVKFGIDAEQISEYSGVVPCSGPLSRTYADRAMFCGNAAGLVYAGTGEGIYFALKSGKLAAESAIDAISKNRFDRRTLKDYEDSWKKAFGKQMKSGKMFAELLEMAYRFDIVKRIFNAPSEQELKDMIIRGILPYRVKLMWRLSKLFKLENKREMPKSIKVMYKICQKYHKNAKNKNIQN